MQFRRSMMSSVMALLLAGAATLAIGTAYADDVLFSSKLRGIENATKARLAKLRTNAAQVDPESTFIGHVTGATGLPGDVSGYGPFHIGRGQYRPTNAIGQSGAANNGYWNFDNLNGGEADIWQGWFSIGMPFQSFNSGAIRVDSWHPFSGFNWGNGGNHKGNGSKPTYGVTGYWHRDGGSKQAPVASLDPNNGPAPDASIKPNFTPFGDAAAWCGLRAHGDFAYTDPITKGVYNSSIVSNYGDNHFVQTGASNTVGKTDANFPGYGDQWDQMLYKDVVLGETDDLNLSYSYDYSFKTGHTTTPELVTGWFNMDPIRDVIQSTPTGAYTRDGNFISASANIATAVEDSFMVYVGVPVNDALVFYTDCAAPAAGVPRPVGDPLRRWFSEVIRINGWTPGAAGVGDLWPSTLIQLVSRSGVGSGTDTWLIPNAQLQPLLDATGTATDGGTVRVVFRLKTNRGWSDEDEFVTGAVAIPKNKGLVIDDVTVNALGAAWGDFEATGSIDNTAATTAAWHSTGKAVGEDYWKLKTPAEVLAEWFDPCGNPGGSGLLCNLEGNAMAPKPGYYATNEMDMQRLLLSPTINLKSTGPLDFNGMGINSTIADATNQYGLYFDMVQNFYWTPTTGNAQRCVWQCFPGVQPNGVTTWATIAKTIGFYNYTGGYTCWRATQSEGLGAEGKTEGLIVTSATGTPDSIRAGVEAVQTCFRRNSTSATTCGAFARSDLKPGYVDNITFCMADGAAAPLIAQGFSWDMGQDAFPTDGSKTVGTDGFRRAPAQMNSAYNIGTGAGLARRVIPADTMLITSNGTNVRADLVFRIKPGPGNYLTIGQPTSGLAKHPVTDLTAATPGDGTFWGSYMADRGIYGTGFVPTVTTAVPNPMVDRFAGGAVDWDPDQWLSARCDTAERNLMLTAIVDGPRQINGLYMSAYHEAELAAGAPRATLGIVKNRCVLVNPASSDVTQTNVACDASHEPAPGDWAARWNPLDPVNYVTSMGGYTDNTCNGPCATGTTAEGTKIIPDNLLTAGSHTEFFFRRTFVGNYANWDMLPDTTKIFPNGSNFDGARWYALNVLPDLWKTTGYDDFGLPTFGLACFLFVDQADRFSQELLWNAMAEQIGLTKPAKKGAGTGYYVGANSDFPADLTELLNPVITPGGTQVSKNLGQVGTYFDMYNVRSGESNTPSGRLGSRDGPVCVGLATGYCSTAGPTKPWLRDLYQNLYINCAGLKDLVWGPEPDQTDDDIGIMKAFIDQPLAAPQELVRNFIVSGDDITAGMSVDATGDPTFFPTYFDATLRADSYRDLVGSTDDTPDLIPTAPIGSGGIYGVFNTCTILNDVLLDGNTITGSVVAATYEDINPADDPSNPLNTYAAAMYAPADVGGSRYANTLLLSFNVANMGSRFTLGRSGYNKFFFDALTGMIGSICGATLTNPVGVGDNLGGGKAFVNFLNLRSPNPMRSGTALIEFGLTKSEKVQVNVYDVTGRLVKTLAEREFKGGETHRLTWDGTDVGGRQVAHGVYFYQLRSPSFTSQKKLTVLRD